MNSLRAVIWTLIAICSVTLAAAEPKFPQLTGPVVDAAGVLNTEERVRLEERLLAYQERSGHQVVVATVPSLEGYDIRDYGNRLFRHWALGDKQRDDGVLLLVAPNDHHVSIEVGYGAEPDLTDALARIIIENAIVPRFKSGDFDGGIAAGLDDISKVLGGEGKDIVNRSRYQTVSGLEDILPLILLFGIVLVIVWNTSRGRRVILMPGPGGRYDGGWSGGGWSGGGGLGGGYGGGGGSSGGGGASGSW